MDRNTPLALQQLMATEYMTVTLEPECCRFGYVVEAPSFGPMFTIKPDWGDFVIKDREGQLIGDIVSRRACFQPVTFEVLTGRLAPVFISTKSFSRSILICDERDLQILKIKPESIFSNTYHILAQNDAMIGEFRTSTWTTDYTMSCPRDLDVRYKMALAAAVVFRETIRRQSQAAATS